MNKKPADAPSPQHRRKPLSRARRAMVVAAGLLVFAAFGATASGAQPATSTPVVTVSGGRVQGIVASRVDEYLGIPYAAPPIGDLRWQPPQDPAAWPQLRQATAFANTCPQEKRGIFASPSTTEDCLYLNVFAPRSGAHTARKRPVMVWIYGGGLFSGESNDYDGSALARRGNVIVVTLNYRIGVLGFLSHPALNAEGHPAANYGIMDQQFALKWVKRNIAAFGGDPDNVTIFGQSGGGTAVMANLVSPTAAGLFQRAINESGTHIVPMPPDAALKAAEEFATAAGCADQSAKCLRALSVEQILRHHGALIRLIAANFPVVDGTIITHTAYEAFSKGLFNRVPIVTGLVHDEQAFFLPETNTHVPLTADGFNHDLASFGAANVEKLAARYPLASYASPSLADIALQQGFKACTARQLDRAWAKYVPVFAYEFDDRTAPSYYPPMSYPMGAYHTAELQFLFPLFHGGQGTPHPLDAAQQQLSHTLIQYWTSFARTGKPQAATRTGPHWTRYADQADDVLSLDLHKSAMTKGYGTANSCALWDSVIAYE